MVIPTRVGGTRWLPHTQRALRNVITGYDAIKQHLEQLQNPSDVKKESSAKARNFLKLMKDKSVFLWFHFMLDVIKSLSTVSETIQNKNSTLADVWDELEGAKSILTKYISSDGPYLRKVREENDGFEKKAGPRVTVLNGLIESISSRFEVDEELFRACTILNLEKWPQDLTDQLDFGEDYIRVMVDMARPAMNKVDGIDIDAIETEWIRLRTSVYSNRKQDPLSWPDLYRMYGAKFTNFFTLVDFMLTLPSSSVDAERGFSSMKMVKNDWRSRLGDGNLSDLLMVLLETPRVDEFDPSEAIHLWYKGGVRSKRPYYKDDMKNCRRAPKQVVVLGEGGEDLREDGNMLEAELETLDDESEPADIDDDDDMVENSMNLGDVQEMQLKAYEMFQQLIA